MEERISKWLPLLKRDNCYCTKADEDICLEEPNSEGYARITITHKNPCIVIKNMDKNCFPLLSHQKCCDHLLIEEKQSSYVLHIIEMKKTLTMRMWNPKMVPQFQGGWQHALLVAGILHIPNFSDIHCYTASRRIIELDPETSTNPTLFRQQVGLPSSPRCIDDAKKVPLCSIIPNCYASHKVIKLTEDNGFGVLSLDN